jgi:hypothetical protein
MFSKAAGIGLVEDTIKEFLKQHLKDVDLELPLMYAIFHEEVLVEQAKELIRDHFPEINEEQIQVIITEEFISDLLSS